MISERPSAPRQQPKRGPMPPGLYVACRRYGMVPPAEQCGHIGDLFPGAACHLRKGHGGLFHKRFLDERGACISWKVAGAVPVLVNEDALLRAVAARLKALRTAADLTQEALAERLGRDLRQCQRYETGRENMSLRTLARIARALEVEPAELLRGPTP